MLLKFQNVSQIKSLFLDFTKSNLIYHSFCSLIFISISIGCLTSSLGCCFSQKMRYRIHFGRGREKMLAKSCENAKTTPNQLLPKLDTLPRRWKRLLKVISMKVWPNSNFEFCINVQHFFCKSELFSGLEFWMMFHEWHLKPFKCIAKSYLFWIRALPFVATVLE